VRCRRSRLAALSRSRESLERNVDPTSRFDLRHSERLEKLLQEHFTLMGRRAMGRQHESSVIIGAAHPERVRSFEPEHNPILIVHAHGVEPSFVAAEPVQSVPGRYPAILNPCYGVDLIELALHIRPELARNPTGRFAVGAVPDVLCWRQTRAPWRYSG